MKTQIIYQLVSIRPDKGIWNHLINGQMFITRSQFGISFLDAHLQDVVFVKAEYGIASGVSSLFVPWDPGFFAKDTPITVVLQFKALSTFISMVLLLIFNVIEC